MPVADGRFPGIETGVWHKARVWNRVDMHLQQTMACLEQMAGVWNRKRGVWKRRRVSETGAKRVGKVRLSLLPRSLRPWSSGQALPKAAAVHTLQSGLRQVDTTGVLGGGMEVGEG